MSRYKVPPLSADDLALAKGIWLTATGNPNGLIIQRETMGQAHALKIWLFRARNVWKAQNPRLFDHISKYTIKVNPDCSLHLTVKLSPLADVRQYISQEMTMSELRKIHDKYLPGQVKDKAEWEGIKHAISITGQLEEQVDLTQDILVAEGLREPIGADSEARMLPRDVQVMLPAPVPEAAQPSVTDWLRDNGFLPEENPHAE